MGFGDKMKSLKIVEKIYLLIALPIAGLLFFFGLYTLTQYERVEHASKTVPIVKISNSTTSLIHELQKERGMTSAYLASANKDDVTALLKTQRELTDIQQHIFNDHLQYLLALEDQREAVDLMKNASRELKRLEVHRKEADNHSITINQNINYYTNVIRLMMRAISAISHSIERDALTSQLSTYRTLMLLKDYSGLERAIGSAMIAKGIYDPQLYRQFVDIVARQEGVINEFETQATPEQRQQFYNAFLVPDANAVLELRDKLLNSAQMQHIDAVSLPDWWAKASARIDMYRVIERQMSDRIYRHVIQEAYTAKKKLFVFTVISIALIAGVMIMIGLIGRTITKQIGFVAHSIEVIALGGNGIKAPPYISTRTEVGRIFNALRTLIDIVEDRRKLYPS